VVSEEDLLSDLGLRIRDVFIASDGAVLLLTDDTKDKDENKISGQLIRLSPK
jgi:glucose/arabinose dehydrogenase